MANTIVQTVQDQLTAFRAGDFDKAYGYAVSGIRETFTPEAFKAMVEKGYPLVATATKAEFGIALDNGHKGSVFVTVFDAAGACAHYQYSMELEEDSWKIAGVFLADVPMKSA